MIVLDTNIFSELMLIPQRKIIVEWLDSLDEKNIFTTSITVMEIDYGIQILPDGKRKLGLHNTFQQLINSRFKEKILIFDTNAAYHAAHLMAQRKYTSHPLDWRDAQIAGIVFAHEATLATRNVKDFEGCNFSLLNPFA